MSSEGAVVHIVPESGIDESVLLYKLTFREREISELICKGLDTKKIAETLYISQSTVKAHLHNLYAKTRNHRKSRPGSGSHCRKPFEHDRLIGRTIPTKARAGEERLTCMHNGCTLHAWRPICLLLQVRDLPKDVYAKINYLAEKEHRSLAQETIALLKEALRHGWKQGPKTKALEEMNDLDIDGSKFPDPVALIREDRERSFILGDADRSMRKRY